MWLVNKSRVYRLRQRKRRIYEAIEAAGGLCVDAAAECVNQARKVGTAENLRADTEEAERGWERSLRAASDVPGTAGNGCAHLPRYTSITAYGRGN